VLLQLGKQMVSWAPSKRGGQQVEGGDPPHLVCPGEATPGEPHLFLGSPAHRRQGAAGESRVEEHKDDY